MTYVEAYYFSDVVFSEMFENLPMRYNWSESELFAVNTTQKYTL